MAHKAQSIFVRQNSPYYSRTFSYFFRPGDTVRTGLFALDSSTVPDARCPGPLSQPCVHAARRPAASLPRRDGVLVRHMQAFAAEQVAAR